MLKKTFHLLLLLIILSQAVSLAQTNDTIPPEVAGDLSVNYTASPKNTISPTLM